MDATVDRRRRSALLHRGRVTGEGHPLRPPHVRAPQTLGHLWWRGRLLPQHIPDSSVPLGHRRRHLNPATGACRLMPTTHTQVGWLRWCRACSAWVGGTPAGCRSETARALASNPTIPTHISSQKSRRDLFELANWAGVGAGLVHGLLARPPINSRSFCRSWLRSRPVPAGLCLGAAGQRPEPETATCRLRRALEGRQPA